MTKEILKKRKQATEFYQAYKQLRWPSVYFKKFENKTVGFL